MTDDSSEALEQMLRKLFLVGWICLIISGVFLAISVFSHDPAARGSETTMAVWLTLARIVGIGSFIIGLIAIFNRRWTTGTILFGGSIVLPALSLVFHGTV